MEPCNDNNESNERRFAFFRGREDFGKISQEFQRKGLRGAARLLVLKSATRLRWWTYYFYHRPFDRSFDRRFGVDTCGVSFLSDLTVDGGNKASGLEYEPTPVRGFARMLTGLPGDLGEFVFIDFGSGKGRTLLLASRHNFKAIIGVEFAQELHAIAQNNASIYKARDQKCLDIRPTWIDAARFAIPDEKCIFYFYYPFHEEVMQQVLANIADSYAARPRKMYFINRLDKPEWVRACQQQFAKLGFVRHVRPSGSPIHHAMATPFKVLTYETCD